MDLKAKIEKLLDLVSQSERVQLGVMNNAVASNIKAYSQDPTAAKKRDMDAAREGLEELVDTLWRRYVEKGAGAFTNLLAALEHLQREGYKVKKSKLYADKNKGLIRIESDGSVLRQEVDRYADRYLVRPGDETGEGEALARKKAELDIELRQEQLRRLRDARERELGGWIKREDLEMELAGRAVVLEAGLRNMIRQQAGRWLALGKGDQRCLPDVVEAMMVDLDAQLDTYATTDRFQVLILPDDGEAEEL